MVSTRNVPRRADRPAQGAIAIGVVLVTVVAYGQLLLWGRTFADPTYLGEVVPALGYLGERLASLEIPEWWDGVGLGVPFAANPDHPALYPPAWLIMAATPAGLGADLLVIAHTALLGIGTGRLSSRLGAGDPAAIVAGGAAAVCGATMAALPDGSVVPLAWVPWALLAAQALALADQRRARARAALALAGALAVQLYAGTFDYAPATLLATLALASAGRRPLPALAWAAAAALVAAVLAAAVLVPAHYVDLAASPRAGAAGWAGLASLVAPRSTSLIGPAIALLALLAVRQKRARGAVVIALVIAVLGAAHAAAHLAVVAVIACALAGVGLEQLTELGSWGLATAGAMALAAAIALPDPVVAVGLLLVAGSIGLVVLRPPAPDWARALVAATVVGQLVAAGWQQLATIERDEVGEAPGLLAAALAEPSAPPPRISRPPLVLVDRQPGTAVDVERRAHGTALPNRAVRWGGSYIRGRDRAIDPRLHRIWRAAALAGNSFHRLYAVDLAAVPKNVVLAANLSVIAEDDSGQVALIEVEGGRPRAFVASRWRWVDDERRLEGALLPSAVGSRRGIELATVHLSGSGAAGGTEGPAPARPCVIDRWRPERVDLDCSTTRAGYAVLLDSAAAGWRATVEGETRPIIRADLLARAVAIDAGQARVSFVYRTPGLRLGGVVAGLAWLNWLGALVLMGRRRQSTAPP